MKKLKTLIISSISRLAAIPLAVKSGILFVKNQIDIRDVHVYGGIVLIASGLYLYSPSIALTVSGSILLLIGLLIK